MILCPLPRKVCTQCMMEIKLSPVKYDLQKLKYEKKKKTLNMPPAGDNTPAQIPLAYN